VKYMRRISTEPQASIINIYYRKLCTISVLHLTTLRIWDKQGKIKCIGFPTGTIPERVIEKKKI
ncbi:MAG: hypothetical protein QW428_03610, partial [Conexivisphaerales archaeon]